VPGTQRAFLSIMHTDVVIDEVIDVFCQSLADVHAEGLFAAGD